MKKLMKIEMKEIKHCSIRCKIEEQIDRRLAPRLETTFVFDKIIL